MCGRTMRRRSALYRRPGVRDAPRAGGAVAPADIDGSRTAGALSGRRSSSPCSAGASASTDPGIYLAALHHSHGWPIATISLAITAHFPDERGPHHRRARRLSPLRRRLDHHRRRRLAARPAPLPGPMPQEIWQLVPALLLSGAGWSAMSGAALNLIVAPWFERDRPKAISTAFNGASIGGLLFVPAMDGVDRSRRACSCRRCWLALATVGVVCPVAWARAETAPSRRGVEGSTADAASRLARPATRS